MCALPSSLSPSISGGGSGGGRVRIRSRRRRRRMCALGPPQYVGPNGRDDVGKTATQCDRRTCLTGGHKTDGRQTPVEPLLCVVVCLQVFFGKATRDQAVIGFGASIEIVARDAGLAYNFLDFRFRICTLIVYGLIVPNSTAKTRTASCSSSRQRLPTSTSKWRMGDRPTDRSVCVTSRISGSMSTRRSCSTWPPNGE